MWGYGPHAGFMSGYGGWGFGLLHMVFWLVILVAVIVAAIWLIRSMAGGSASPVEGRRSPGLDVLEERYARGEINRDEYLEKKKDILG